MIAMLRRRYVVALLTGAILGLAVLLPSAALAAGSSSCQAYNPQLCSVTTTGTPSTSTLPFTGLDIALLVAGGVLLLGAGFAVRVAARRLTN